MQTVAILGAGDLGGTLARTLAGTDAVRRILLIDTARGVAAGKALDIQQSGPIEGFHTSLEGTDDVDAVSRAQIVVLADAHGASEWDGEAALQLVGRASRAAPGAALVFAGARQQTVMACAIRDLHVPASRLVGSAPLAAAASVRALVAPDLNASALDVTVGVLGVPPAWVVTWSEAAVNGTHDAAIHPVTCTRVERMLAATWPPGVYSLASAASTIIRAMASSSRRQFCCFAAVNAGGVQRAVVAVPVTLDPGGVRAVHLPALSVREQVAFDGALAKGLF
jgi:malate dehydrogenase